MKTTKMRTIKFCLLFLMSCNDFSFGSMDSNANYPRQKPTTIDGHCTNDEQCGEGLVCWKQGDNYVGVCASVR